MRILLIPILFYFISPAHSENQSELVLYESILKESYYDIKIELGEQLGQLQTKVSVELLNKLLENPYHWNREAAIAGILFSNKPEFNQIVIRQFLRDPILRPRIRRGIIKNIHSYIDDIKKTYEVETNPKYRNLLHNLIAISPNSEEYFRQQIKTITDNKEKNKEVEE